MARLSWPGWLVTYQDGLPVLKTVTHPSTNRARRSLTSLMRPTTLPTKPNRDLGGSIGKRQKENGEKMESHRSDGCNKYGDVRRDATWCRLHAAVVAQWAICGPGRNSVNTSSMMSDVTTLRLSTNYTNSQYTYAVCGNKKHTTKQIALFSV